jgi:hypothetical protein
MDAEEFLRAKTAYCERLRMRLTTETCQKLRTRRQSNNPNAEYADGPPLQCEDCAGLGDVASGDIGAQTAPPVEKMDVDHIVDANDMVAPKKEDIVPKLQYTMQELADAAGVDLKAVQNARRQRPLAPKQDSKIGKVVYYMREHYLDWGDIIVLPRKYVSNWPKKQADAPEPGPAPATPEPDEDVDPAVEAAPMGERAAPEPDSTEAQATPADASPFLPDFNPPHEIPPSSGVKHDAGKLRLDLIPPEILRALGEVLTHGADKYTDRNWERGIALDRVYAALLRHLLAWREGEAIDAESGLPHLAHALTNAGMLLTLDKRQGPQN